MTINRNRKRKGGVKSSSSVSSSPKGEIISQKRSPPKITTIAEELRLNMRIH